MTGKERITNILNRKPVDRIGLSEHFWSDTRAAYADGGYVNPGESLEEHFELDIREIWPFNFKADVDFRNKIIAETEDTVTVLDGNGAYLRRHKFHDTTPEHVDFTVKTRTEWEQYKPFLLEIDERRIDFGKYREAKAEAAANERFFCIAQANIFELIHPLCGHENMLIGMVEDPDWIIDMAETYSNLIIGLQKMLFEREGKPDGVWYYDDLGFKERPFMSPSMYQEYLMPYHAKTHKFAHDNGLYVIWHSCGFIEPLLPYMMTTGFDCLNVIEIKAGMDLLRIYKEYGGKIALAGGIDVRVLYSNDKAAIDAELETKIPIVKEGGGFILHSDHSIPKTVNYDTYKYFIEKGLELGRY
jgi:uroporphyrinogen decarboxylase